jgi:hypothetical protein
MMAEHQRLHPEEVIEEVEFWAWKKQERRAAREKKWRKKA